ncbi:hypothetical protein I4U23_000339 [Adineta vaga]|nr:hypothetical protein I4U23_000339 [Adineta vaga]
MSSNNIVELHLFRCNRETSIDLPNVSHLNLIDSLDSLHCNLFSLNIRSVQIILHYECLCFAPVDWTTLRALSTLPLLKSFRILLYDMRIPPDDTSCQIIAETASMLSNFSFFFRHMYNTHKYDMYSTYKKHWLFIKQLKKRLLDLSSNVEPYVCEENDGCGLFYSFD